MKFGSTAAPEAARVAASAELLKKIEAKRAELAEVRERNATLAARHVQLLDRQAALKTSLSTPNPSELWQIEQVARDLGAIRSELESGEAAALAYELTQLEQPTRRAEEARRLADAEKEDAELAQVIQDCRSKILKKAESAVSKHESFNAAHQDAERAAGEAVASSRGFDRATSTLLKALWAYGAAGFEWDRRMRAGSRIALGDYSLHL